MRWLARMVAMETDGSNADGHQAAKSPAESSITLTALAVTGSSGAVSVRRFPGQCEAGRFVRSLKNEMPHELEGQSRQRGSWDYVEMFQKARGSIPRLLTCVQNDHEERATGILFRGALFI